MNVCKGEGQMPEAANAATHSERKTDRPLPSLWTGWRLSRETTPAVSPSVATFTFPILILGREWVEHTTNTHLWGLLIMSACLFICMPLITFSAWFISVFRCLSGFPLPGRIETASGQNQLATLYPFEYVYICPASATLFIFSFILNWALEQLFRKGFL